MAYYIDLINNLGTYTFQITPQFLPSASVQYNTNVSPSQVAIITTTWSIRGAYLVNSDQNALYNEYKTVINKILDLDNPLSEVKFRLDSTVLDSLTRGANSNLEVESYSVREEQGLWSSFTVLDIVIKHTQVGNVSGEVGTTSEETTSYTYDPSTGLLTQSRKGTVKKGAGGALSFALGRALSLPNDTEWRYLTNGPQGIDVEVNASDTEASYTSTIQQLALKRPNKNVFDYTITESTRFSGEEGAVKEISVTATAVTAEEAEQQVKALEPENVLLKEWTYDKNDKRWTARYTVSDIDAMGGGHEGVLTVIRTFRISGGGRILSFLPVDTLNSMTKEVSEPVGVLIQSPTLPYTIEESYELRLRNVRILESIEHRMMIPPPIPALEPYMSRGDSVTTLPVIEAFDLSGRPISFVRTGSRKYVVPSKLIPLSEMFKAIRSSNQFRLAGRLGTVHYDGGSL
ncbi:MAG: hypothetical protein KatS3mg087_1307 [Patescibacteria group bacterium]|nr:MAG: hypothetical protein KatS3mg087_1307 [Patescibacteria group bacterium]